MGNKVSKKADRLQELDDRLQELEKKLTQPATLNQNPGEQQVGYTNRAVT